VIRLLADENFNNNIVRGVRLRESGIDLVRVQDVGLSGADDPSVLEWAPEHQRVLLTHDVATLTAFAYQRVHAGKSMPGVFELSLTVPLSFDDRRHLRVEESHSLRAEPSRRQVSHALMACLFAFHPDPDQGMLDGLQPRSIFSRSEALRLLLSDLDQLPPDLCTGIAQWLGITGCGLVVK